MLKLTKYIIYFFKYVLLLLAAISVCNSAKGNDKNTYNFNNTLNKLREIDVDIPLTDVNKLDNNGKKNGIWITETEYRIYVGYYKNGMRDGVDIWYDNLTTPIKIMCISSYSHDVLREIINFDDDGTLSYMIQDIGLNDKFSEFRKFFKYLGHLKLYENGRLQSEGYIIFDEDWEIDCEEIGDWKIYDGKGNFTIENKWPVGYNL